jgi:hypothetical protein
MAAMAAANLNPVFQDYYLRFRSIQADPLQLFYLDPDLDRMSPEGAMPRGKAYQAHGALISSRSSWDWEAAASVVGSKARREDNHEHNDSGQIVIDGCGKNLVVDLGVPETSYPKNFFTRDRFRYYDTQAFGHNILVFGGRDMLSCYELHPNYTEGPLHGKKALHAQGKILSSEFDDHWGGHWVLDTTDAWAGVSLCRRSVLHLHPGFIVVLDEATLDEKESISLRWHTIEEATLHGTGHFSLELDTVSLAGIVETLDTRSMEIRIGNHTYEEPWNKDQFGGILPERNAPYIEFLTNGTQCRILSLFAVQPGGKATLWSGEGPKRWVNIEGAELRLEVQETGISVSSNSHQRGWEIPFQRK